MACMTMIDRRNEEARHTMLIEREDEAISEAESIAKELDSAIKASRRFLTQKNELAARRSIASAVKLSTELDRRRLMLDEAIVRRDMIDARTARIQSAIDASHSVLQVLTRMEPATPPDGPHVYFVAEDSGEFMKIGRSSNTHRVSDLQTSNPRRLVLIACLPGDRGLETRCHKAFATEYVRGEWFRISRRLAAFALEVREGHDVSWFFEAQCA